MKHTRHLSSTDFLYKILDTPSPTGMEIQAQRIWADYVAPYTDAQECDAYGSTWATLRAKQKNAPTLMLDAHADEIGFSIRHITDDGFAYVERLGGSDVAIARGRRLRFFGDKGEVFGIIGNTAIHIREDQDKAPKLWELYVDLGCRSKEEVEKLGLHVGDRAVYCDGPLMLNDGGRLVCRALDDRLCGYIVAETARALHERKIRPAWNIIFANSVQEEVGCYGAQMLTYRIHPDAAICLDVTHATDTPGLAPTRYGEVKLGLGPCLCIGPACHPKLNARIEQVAAAAKLPLQRETSGRATGTNTDSIFRSREGVPSTNLSLPLRYMHSPVETADLADVSATVDVLVEFIVSLKASEHFRHTLRGE